MKRKKKLRMNFCVNKVVFFFKEFTGNNKESMNVDQFLIKVVMIVFFFQVKSLKFVQAHVFVFSRFDF